MAELVAEAFLSAVFKRLFELLSSPEFRKNSTGNQLKQLDSKLKKARLLLDDAENRQLGEPDVKEWLEGLKHVVFQADDLAEEINDKKNGRKSFRSIYGSLAGTVKGEIGLILTELDNLLEQADVLDLKHGNCDVRNRGYSPAITTPLREEHHVFGRNGDKDKIFELLSSDGDFGGDRIGVVPIVGMGGLGKTTLAHLVYNDERVKDLGFELRAWVTVSTEFNVFRILKSILQQMNQPCEVGEPTELQRKMKDALRGKKFLFVLDDVWDENYNNWDLLMSNFSTGVFPSRILVTTRSTKLGAMVKTGPIHEIGQVSDDDCWSIFIHHALICVGDSNSDPQLREIGRQIVKKCKGVPLAVKAIGGLLRSERSPRKWESVLNSHVWEWGENKAGNEVLQSLWLSYRYLPSSLKQCFAYCSVFPQDYKFEKKQMVLWWMAEGFLPSDFKENRSMEETGEQYFEDLVSRSLFQRGRKVDVSKFVVHDLIHDLATFISGEFCVSVAREDVKLKHVTSRTRHLSYHYNSSDFKLWSSLSKAKHLRSFHTHDLWQFRYSRDDEFVKKLIMEQRRFRVLSIFRRNPISASLCDLKHLRYLNLSRNSMEELPSSVCTLFNLQTLILAECRSLTRLPRGITNLIKLRHLDITRTPLRNMPPHMGNLKELRTLTDFSVGDSDVGACSSITALRELQHLSGELRISGLNMDKVEDIGKDILRHKANLMELHLEWKYTDATKISRTEAKDILNALQPHAETERLFIRNYPASSFPIWVQEMSFWKLVSLTLSGDFCNSLPPLGHLPSLSKLVIRGFHAVEKIGSEFYGNSSVTPFPCLETLAFYNMKSWKEWVFVDKAFPCLKGLTLWGCVALPVSLIDCKTIEIFQCMHNSLECFPLSKFPMLRKLFLYECPNLKTITNGDDNYIFNSMSRESFPKTLTHLRGTTRQSPWDRQNHSLKDIYISECNELESLPEKELPRNLSSLDIIDCALLEKKYHKSKGESYQQISHIPKLYIQGDTTRKIDGEGSTR